VQAFLVDYRVLGELEVVDGARRIEIPPGKQRSLLALLLLHRNEAVSTDRLIDELWGDSPPTAAEKSVQVYVSRLRKRLPEGRLLTRGSGYELHVEDSEVDSDRFERMLAEGRAALAADDATAAAPTLLAALGLWRGSALADFRYEPFAQAEIARLEELRIAAHAELAEAELALGRNEQLVPQLQSLVAQHPLQERLRGQLMLALYRSGRQSEALESYREGRRRLVDELGIEPGPQLKELEQAILRQDVPVAAPPGNGGAVAIARPRHARFRGRGAVALAAALAVALAAVAFLAIREATSDGVRQAPSIAPRSVVAIDPSNGAVVADVRVGALPGPAAAGVGRLWVGTGARLLIAIDVRSRRILGRFGLPAPAHQIAAGDGIVWIGNDYDGTVSRLDERVGFVSRPFRPQRKSTGRLVLATGFGSLWVGSQDGRIARIDPTRDRLIATIRGIRAPQALAAGEGAVWLIEATRAAVVRIDPRTNRVVRRVALGVLPTAVAVGAGAVWVSTSDGRIWRIDPSANRVRATITVGGSPIAIEPTGRFVWVAYADGELRAIDPASNEVRATVQIERPLADVASANGLLWATVG
jgi:DNA-binding SARP family transcriptional activator/streptogramin lyase